MKIRKIKTVEYILKNELEETKPSKFYLTDLNPYQAADVYDILTKNGSVTLNINVMIKATELGISDWKNVMDDKKQFKFSKTNILSLPVEVLSEIGVEVLKNSFPEFAEVLGAEEDKENLE